MRKQRPTREETRERLLQAAARVFSRNGIGGTSIEDICDEAEFSRGAFYSNFGAKEEIVIELLDLHMQSSLAEIDRLYAASQDPTDFVDNMESDRRERTGPLAIQDGGLLYMELLLFAMRNPANRPRLIAHQREQRESSKHVLERIQDDLGREYPVPLDDIASVIMALDSGLGLLQLVDPDSYRPTQFSEIMGLLHRLWMERPDEA